MDIVGGAWNANGHLEDFNMSLILNGKDGSSVEITIPEHYKKVAVNCSGGADSSLLLYILAKYIKDNALDVKLSVLTCGADSKYRWSGERAGSVVNYVIKNIGSGIIDMHYIYFRDEQDVKYFHEIEGDLLADGRAQLIASGITSNPPPGESVEDIEGISNDLRKYAMADRIGAEHKTWHISTEGKGDFWNPFANVNKKFIADQYDAYNLRSTLLPLTRSCETYALSGDPSPCGKCWWCLERKWAFGYF